MPISQVNRFGLFRYRNIRFEYIGARRTFISTNNNDMTLQDLKDSRHEIIAYLSDGGYHVSNVMSEMVKYLGFNGIKSTSAIDYANEVLALIEGQKSFVCDNSASVRLAEINRRNGAKAYFA